MNARLPLPPVLRSGSLRSPPLRTGGRGKENKTNNQHPSKSTKFISGLDQPAPNPNLALFEDTNRADVLVQYDALSEKHSTVGRQAYYLGQNEARNAAGKKPKLVGLSVADSLKPIPVLPEPGAISNLPPELPMYAVLSREGRGFTLHPPPDSSVAFDLPVYPETGSTPTRIALTPFAVAGDTVMVGVVAAVVGFFLWVQGGGPTHF